MRDRSFAAMWVAVLVIVLGCGVSWAGPLDSLTDKVKGVIKTQTDESVDKEKGQGEAGIAAPAAAQKIRGPEPGNIVFSSVPVDPAKPAQLSGSFKMEDPIYAVAYLGKTVKALSSNPQSKTVNIEISFWRMQPPLYSYQQPSEMFIDYSAVALTGSILEKDVLPFEILPGVDGMTSYGSPEMKYKKFGNTADGPVKIAESFSKLDPGKHTIVFKVKINYADVATGEFDLEGADFTKFSALAEEYRKAEAGQAAASAEMPKAAMKDSKLEAEMIVALKASQTYNDRMKGEIMRFVIIDPDWFIRRHPISGAVLHRYIRAAAAIKDSAGECRVWNLITFQQDFVGGQFQKSRFDGVGDPTPIQCENVK